MITECRPKDVRKSKVVVYYENPIEVIKFFKSFLGEPVTAEIDNKYNLIIEYPDDYNENQIVPISPNSYIVYDGRDYDVYDHEQFHEKFEYV